jgi:hypothetical protein
MLRRSPLAAIARPGIVLAAIALSTAARGDIPELLACADNTDPQARLACYDAAAAKLKAQMAEAEKRNGTLFGFSLPFGDSDDSDHASKLAPQTVNEIDAKLIAVRSDIGGHQILTLNNGQVWRIDDSRNLTLVPGNDLIAVVRNDLGGYYLSINGHDNKLSVTRIR